MLSHSFIGRLQQVGLLGTPCHFLFALITQQVNLLTVKHFYFLSSIPRVPFQTMNLPLVISFVSTALAVPFAAHPAASCSSGIIKRVEMFDTLWIIAMLNNYTMAEIKDANPQLSANWDLIFVGGIHDLFLILR
jgi:hypothetical protein